MDRRRFLRTCGAAGAGLLLPAARWRALAGEPAAGEATAGEAARAAADSAAVAANRPDLALARGAARDAVRRAVGALGGMERFLAPGQVAVVKPNISFDAPPEWGATTHPEVLAAVLELLFAAGARRVVVADHTMINPERCFARSGAAEVVAAFPRAKLVSLDEENAYRPAAVPAGKVLKRTELPRLLDRADLLINLPTAKSHTATGVSLGLKNLMGLVWDRHRFHSEMDLHQAVADLATVVRPALTILDAMQLLKTGGPTGPGDIEAFGGVVAGTDPVAVDALGVTLAPWSRQTWSPKRLAHLRAAEAHGLGTTDLDALKVARLD
ncbi:MAG: DUF362 domain-containing protein [Candidatus Krumholzibacteriota bacterium]|nr:DUF362 domain-containing protein [Candidatus Krumholzibacteriota bacterium]